MPFSIAVAGKGGTGKTALATLIIYHLLRTCKTPVLAVDADPNTNFNVNLGMEEGKAVSDLREDILEKQVSQGMSKSDFMEFKLHELILEGKGVDLLVMGRPEGPGCYCAVNNLLRRYLSRIAAHYQYVVMDNEAGMEHLSRRTTDNVDILFIVSEPTMVSVRSALKVKETAEKIKLRINRAFVVLNKVSASRDLRLIKEKINKNGMNLIGDILFDELINEAGEEARDLLSLPEDSPAVQATAEILKKAGII